MPGVRVALVAIQLEVGASVLASTAAYQRHLEAVVARAVADSRAAGPADARLVVLPEVSGHLALLAQAGARAHKAKTLAGALAQAAVRRPFAVLRGAATARVLEPRNAVLAALTPDAERWWKSVFAPLAKQHRAYIVAGSLLRLSPAGEITNTSLTFDPEGRLVATTDKVNLIPGIEDGAKGALGLFRADADAIPIVETAFGRLCTLICYDAFRRAHTDLERFTPVPPRIAARGGVAIVANPAANPWPWRERWPFDDRVRVDQWEADGLPGTLRETPFARFGVTAHLVGSVLDLRFDGTSEILDGTGKAVARAPGCDRGGHVTATVTC